MVNHILSILPIGRHTQKARPVQGASQGLYLNIKNNVSNSYSTKETGYNTQK